MPHPCEAASLQSILASFYQDVGEVVHECASCPLAVLERPVAVKILFHYDETSLLVVVVTHLLRSNNPVSRTRSTSHLADFFPISTAIIVSGNPKSCGISYSCAGLRSYTRS